MNLISLHRNDIGRHHLNWFKSSPIVLKDKIWIFHMNHTVTTFNKSASTISRFESSAQYQWRTPNPFQWGTRILVGAVLNFCSAIKCRHVYQFTSNMRSRQPQTTPIDWEAARFSTGSFKAQSFFDWFDRISFWSYHSENWGIEIKKSMWLLSKLHSHT